MCMCMYLPNHPCGSFCRIESAEEAALSGMISPPSGYSSGEINTPYANPALLESVRTAVGAVQDMNSADVDCIENTLTRQNLDDPEVGQLEHGFVQAGKIVLAATCKRGISCGRPN